MRGKWWIPGPLGNGEVPASRNAQVFIGDNDEWELTANHSLLATSGPDLDYVSRVVEVPALHGLEGSDRAVSLLNAHIRAYSLEPREEGGNTRRWETWQSEWYAAGDCHVEPDTVASLVEIKFNVLPVWAGAKHSESGRSGVPLGHFADKAELPPNEAVTAVADGVRVSLVSRWNIINPGPPIIAEKDALFQLRGAVPLRDIRDKWLLPLQRLCQFLALYEVSLTGLAAYVDESDEPFWSGVEISYADLPTSTDRAWTASGECMLATREALNQAGLPTDILIERWLRFDRQYCSPISDFLTSTGHRLEPDVRTYFAHRCAESFHDLRINGTARDPTEHELIVQRVDDALADAQLTRDDKDWVSERLRAGNQKSQGRKLSDLVELAGSTGRLVVDERPHFIRRAIKARNRSIHSDPAAARSRGGPLDVSLFALWWMLRHVFLLELGIDEHRIGPLLRKSREFSVLELMLPQE
ncbi:HEPN domain-containing protein [Candidatus Poriferisodalis sp.]|uniref:HEPN domain-containing protein n=1 Tax=Candidatus Poriferisodalis sp. TaxID=3101277 RepID=UPI003B598133